MRMAVWIAAITLFLCWIMAMIAQLAYAGTTMQGLSKSLNIINLDEEKRASDSLQRYEKDAASSSLYISNSLDRWHLRSLKKAVIDGKDYEKELMILAAIRNVYRLKSELISTVFPGETLGMFLGNKNGDEPGKPSYSEDAIKYHIEILDREVGVLKDDYDIVDLRNAVLLRDREYVRVIVKIIHESLKASEEALSDTEMEDIRHHMSLGQTDQANAIVDKALRVYSASSAVGAMVECSSQVIDEIPSYSEKSPEPIITRMRP
jgi:hypothetical protein